MCPCHGSVAAGIRYTVRGATCAKTSCFVLKTFIFYVRFVDQLGLGNTGECNALFKGVRTFSYSLQSSENSGEKNR